MTDIKDDELPALPEPYSILGFTLSQAQSIQREAIAHGVAMERAVSDKLFAALVAWDKHLSSEPGGEDDTFQHEQRLLSDMRKAIAAYEAKRRQG